MKDILSREISISLRKLGFDEPCVAYYDGENLLIERCFFNELNLNSIFKKRENISFRVSAPNLGQAFRFFRKLGWYYEIYKLEDTWEYFIQDSSHSWIEEGFDDDDECEINCLKRLVDLEMNIRIMVKSTVLSEDEKERQLKNIFDNLNLNLKQ